MASDLGRIVRRYMANVMHGRRDTDGDGREFVTEWSRSGGDELLAAYRKWAPLTEEMQKGIVRY